MIYIMGFSLSALSYTPSCDVNKDNIDPEGEIETAGRYWVLCLTIIRGHLPPEGLVSSKGRVWRRAPCHTQQDTSRHSVPEHSKQTHCHMCDESCTFSHGSLWL